MKFEFPPPDIAGSGSDGVVATGGYTSWSHSDRWGQLPHVEDWRGYGGDSSDTGTLQNAIDLVDALPLRLSPLLTIEAQINVSAGSVSLLGTGWGAVNATAGPAGTILPHCCILWGGGVPAAGTSMIHVMGPPGNYVHDFLIDRVYLGGNNQCPVALRLSSTRTAHIGRLYVERCTENGVLLDDASGLLHYSTKIDELYVGPGSSPACANMNGMNIRQTTGNPSLTWIHGDFLAVSGGANGYGLIFGNVDNCYFAKVAASSAGNRGVLFRGLSDGQTQVSRKNFIAQYSGHNIYAETKSRNVVDWVNSEGTSVTVEPGASLHYKVIDREDGRRWSTFAYDVSTEMELPLGDGYVHTGSPSLTTIGGLKTRCVLFDSASTETWAWTIQQRRFSGGRITKVKGVFIKALAPNGGNVRLELRGVGKFIGQGLGGTMATKLVTLPVAAAATQPMEQFEIVWDLPFDFFFDGMALIHLTRYGADALDTFPDDWALLSFSIFFEANVADGDPPDYRYDSPDDVGDTTG